MPTSFPALEDGAKNMDEALEMCRVAQADGIHTIVENSGRNDTAAETRYGENLTTGTSVRQSRNQNETLNS
jgi:tyrosine-protein phosphatase YwqE